ncbi:MAG TPA: potassium transporter TrkG, partial [Exilispira sp.]|nr:potassium transporter TrkG [Exilispira sp.]
IGFMVAYDLFNYFAQKFGRNKKVVYINPQTKIVLSMYLILNFTGMILFFIFENAKSLNGLYPHEKFLASLFQVVTARTAGFNTLDIASLQPITKLLLEVLMIIGANSGSTGGGIKVSTFFIILSTVFAFIGEKEHVNINRRRISYNNIVKSFSLFFSYLSVVVIALGLILLLDIFDFEKVLFEVISAMGTVGLSCGITPYLKSSSKLVIVVLMFIGRVGPLTFFTALNLSKKNEKVTYPETEIMIG